MARIAPFLFVLFVSLSSWANPPVRIAAVGNSITYGAGIADREHQSYPAQLGRALGSGYEVKNFGVSGTTAMRSGNAPYAKTAQYQASLAYNPQIVLIKLGTNDANTREGNRDKVAECYKKEYQELIDTYKALPTRPRIVLMTPVPCVVTQGLHLDSDPVFQKTIIPAIEELAYENNLEVIDLYHLFDNKEIPSYLMPDKLHPSAVGAARMVERIAPVVEAEQLVLSPALKVVPVKEAKSFNFHGYRGWTWDEVGVKGYKIVAPRVQSKNGAQWVIRARFWGHQPQTDVALLERGFHIVYCPVENLYGSPKAVERWNAFYEKMVGAGFAPKVVLEGMSRGGLIVYNWAAANPDKVAAIYADAPVMDIKSWPLAATDDFAADKTQVLQAYGFADRAAAEAWGGNPIDHAAAVKGIPMLHVVGQADTVVPVADNTDVFKERVQKEGGRVMVVRKEGVGHHPHSLQAPATIVNFVLRNTGQLDNVCTVPIPGQEWRPAAGWKEGCDWWAVADELASMTDRPCDVLMLGNSITQALGGERTRITSFAGKKHLDAALGDSVRWISAGISGDRTEHLLWRLRECGYWKWNPKHVFVTIGVNNLVSGGDDPIQVAAGVEAVVREAAAMWPKAKIVVFGTLPYSNLEKSKAVAAALNAAVWPSNAVRIDPWEWFVAPDGTQRTEYYGGDKLHLSGEGYAMWSKKIAQIVQQSAE